MELILAIPALADPGGPQTYTVTVAEQLSHLGHAVTVYAPRTGAVAKLARERGVTVVADADELPQRPDAVVTGVDRALALWAAERHPDAVRVFVVHAWEAIHGPPSAPGVVHASVVLSDGIAGLTEASVGAGRIVRMTQPVDLQRFSHTGEPPARPHRVLLLGNYLQPGTPRHAMLVDAWGEDLEWHRLGHPHPSLAVPEAIAEADVVVGYGRSILEAMACGRPAYVFDHSGHDGWVTPETYPAIEAKAFSGMGGPPATRELLRAGLDAYRPELGQNGRDLARAHHNARVHAADLVALIHDLAPEPAPQSPDALRALARLAEAQLRAEVTADEHRMSAARWFDRAQEINDRLARVDAERAAAEAEAAALQAQIADIRSRRAYRVAMRVGDVARAVRGAARRR